MKNPCIYILSNKNRTTLYIGVTNDLERRVLEYKAEAGSMFTAKYNLHDLLYFEEFSSMIEAITREKQLKNWHSEWKWNLIRAFNPSFQDLAADWFSKDEVATAKKDLKDIYLKSDSE